MNRRLVRSAIASLVLALTASACIYFLGHHPAIIVQLRHTPSTTLLALLILYLLFMVSLWLIFRSSLMLCAIRLPRQETLLVTAYSSIINFFGPLQSGPAFRALYLKKRHAVGVKKYALASLVYYAFYAGFSGLFLLVGILGWWVIALGLFCILLTYGLLQLPHTKLQQLRQLRWQGIFYTGASTLLQVAIFAVIFYVELHSVNHAISVRQAIIYTGAANFALFVSITPAAIGFRESFVLLSQQLHHIPTATAIAAGLIDRGVYIAMLLLLGVFIFGTQARANLKKLTN